MSTEEAITSMEAVISKKNFGAERKKILEGAIELIRPLQGNFSEDSFSDIVVAMNNKNYKPNTRCKVVSAIKFLSKQARTGIDVSEWKTKPEETDNIYLTESELNQLYYCDRLEGTTLIATHCFLIMSWTGLRVSDYTKINDADIEDGMFKIRGQKTGSWAYIPIHDTVKKILKIYNGKIPKLSRSAINIHIKRACLLAEIQKWKEVKAHTGRRSAGSNLFLKKVDIGTIKEILGHKNISTTYGYIKCTTKEKIGLVKNVWK